MALTGTLRDFGIAEILQLIGTQKKTGVLTVEDNKRRAEIEFDEGLVVGANGGEESVDLGERFVRSGMLSSEQLEVINKRVRETLKPLPAVLVSDGYIEPATLREMINRHFSEIVYEVFDWKSGTYAFQQKFLQWDKQLVVPIPAESIMMEGLRIVDEGPGVRKLIPSLDDVYSPVVRSAGELDQIDPEAKQLYDLVDGKRILKDVILISNQSKFDAMRHLAWMRMNRFIVKHKDPDSIERAEQKRPQRLTVITLVALYLLLAVSAVVVSIRIGQTVWSFATPIIHFKEPGISGATLLEDARENRVRAALKIYHLHHGHYPDKLDVLLQEKLVRGSDIKPRGNPPFPYQSFDSGKRYLLGETAKAVSAQEGDSTQ